MAEFPKLRTGAVAQYPTSRSLAFSTRVVEFIDGAEQRYQDWSGKARKWKIRLELLDESEMAAIEEFFIASAGRTASFAFTDPNDNAIYPDCSFDDDSLSLEFEGEMRGKTTLTVKENRS